MGYGEGMVRFGNEGLDAIQSQTSGQQERYQEIWDDVHTQLLGLIEQGQVDASIGSVLNERDEQFRREAGGFDDSVSGQNRAMRDVQMIGNEGGSAMVRAAMGGGR
ncbi:hypothetical protein RM844_08005 [Streptomyces sp. DSM 44915]|uniref:Uncharacterized protein n=1 Tax=Streptomyces chisholmiae TaxID=3075540 RepID=A0ABU2JML9_9ACTN|nr:hypothetical protein [Streptomyces sp. DSM 44915]MDT0266237.1 hypothetical protein [Streptomyces sp. DSM 44915]